MKISVVSVFSLPLKAELIWLIDLLFEPNKLKEEELKPTVDTSFLTEL